MSMPFYVAPEQVMKDRADYARQRVARGRPVAAVAYADGVLIVTENASRSLHKISEIYDRIAFAGVGRYNEFDQLRVAGVRHADTKGYAYSREDVDARSLANIYAQYVGQVFTHEMKPLEVEILVAELGIDGASNEMYHISYDGSTADEGRICVLGAEADVITERLASSWREGWSLTDALRATIEALGGANQHVAPGELEVAVLARSNGRRAFQRISEAEIVERLEAGRSGRPGPEPERTGPSGPEPGPAGPSGPNAGPPGP